MPRRSLLAGLAVVVCLAIALTAGAASGGGGSKSQLSKADRAALAEARADGDRTVTLLIAARAGATKDVAAGLASLGSTVRYRDDTLGYLRAIVPIAKVEAAAALAGIQEVNLDQVIPLDDPRPTGIAPILSYAPPDASTPRNNPYLPIGDTGAAQFTDAHPTWDGRGVTIGQVDTGVSLDNPSLLTTSTGERKVVDWVTGTDPITDNDPTWVNMADQVSGASFTYKGVAYTAPAAGSYRIGLFDERDPRLGGEVGRDVNRDGNPAGSSGIFAVLWNTGTNDVWVDTNQNHSFADEQTMTDYKVRHDVGTFGTDNPATAVREQMPFTIQTDGPDKYVDIGIVSGFHASHVAGIMTGNQLFGGAMSGAAPGAKLVSLRACLFIAGCTAHALLEGMIFVAKQENVDVINMSIGGLPALNDGNNTRCVVYKRLIEQSNVQMFISAGNDGPGVNTAGDPGLCGGVVDMGASVTRSTYNADYGTDVKFADNLLYFTSRGPREDGGFAPTLVAPGAAVSTAPLWQPGVGLPYALPPGYQLANGTSMAAPEATGAAALLISAAKQASVQKQPAQLRQALISSARYLTEGGRYQPFDQGDGLINVGGAWNLLKTNIKTVDISSSVAVHTALSGFLATPGTGPGIYDREGVQLNQATTRTYTFTRNDGPGGSVAYNLSWTGNDGTFGSLPGSISLPKGSPVTLPVGYTATSPGAHAAILNLDDPTTVGIDYQTMNTVIAPYTFDAPGYQVTLSGTIDRAQQKHYFFRVPAGAPALKVDFSGPSATPGTGQARFLRWHPWGLGIDSNAVSNCYQPPAAAGCSTGSPTSRTTTNPTPGVWEVSVDGRRSSDADDAAFTLTVTLLGASVSPNPDVIASATLGTPIARSYTLANLFGPFTGRAVGTSLGSALKARPTIANLEQQQRVVNVAAGSTSLRATIGNPSDPAADLDLFVFNCTTGTCALAGQSADGDSEESVTINNPAAGTWVVLVDGFSVPAGATEFDYIDVFANAAFGAISVTDANALRPAGATWTVPASVTANAAPAAGRILYGNVQVRTDTNVLIGQGDVIVESVTP